MQESDKLFLSPRRHKSIFKICLLKNAWAATQCDWSSFKQLLVQNEKAEEFSYRTSVYSLNFMQSLKVSWASSHCVLLYTNVHIYLVFFPNTVTKVNFVICLTKLNLTPYVAIGILMVFLESTGIQNKYDMKFTVNLKLSRKITLIKSRPYQIVIIYTKVIRMLFECLYWNPQTACKS